jgi:hypothetical protein
MKAMMSQRLKYKRCLLESGLTISSRGLCMLWLTESIRLFLKKGLRPRNQGSEMHLKEAIKT